jgi:hypothetical protein
MEIQEGSFVEIRRCPRLFEAVDDIQPDLTTRRLSCITDDVSGGPRSDANRSADHEKG